MNQAIDKELRNMLNEISLKLTNLMDDYLFQLKKMIEEKTFNNLLKSLQDKNPDHEDQSK